MPNRRSRIRFHLRSQSHIHLTAHGFDFVGTCNKRKDYVASHATYAECPVLSVISTVRFSKTRKMSGEISYLVPFCAFVLPVSGLFGDLFENASSEVM